MFSNKKLKDFNQIKHLNKRKASGVGLIEVMITMLVLSIGLIGVASLQLHALQANQNSMQRTKAINLTYDLLDRLRANRENAINHNHYLTNQSDTQRFNNNFTTLGLCNDPLLAHNNSSNHSVNDFNNWINILRCTLPQGHARIERENTNNQYTITIRWSSINLEGSEVENWESFTTRTAL